MKTKDLIRLLEETDPTGEMECCVNDIDILNVCQEPAPYEVLVRDPVMRGHNVIGAKVIFAGTKIAIKTHSIESAIMDDPNIPVDASGDRHGKYSRKIADWRRKSRQVISEIDEWYRKVMSGKDSPLGD